MLLKELRLIEMPVRSVTQLGNFDRNHGFNHEDDRKAVTNPKLIEKLKTKLAGVQQDIVMYFVNAPGARKGSLHGLVDYDQLGRYLPAKIAKQIASEFEADNHDAINVVYVANQGKGRFVMTPWIITHRMWHSFNSSLYAGNYVAQTQQRAEEAFVHIAKRVIHEGYRVPEQFMRDSARGKHFHTSGDQSFQTFKKFYEAMGTTRACRMRNLSFPFEIFPEMFTQKLITGSIKVNPLPDVINFGKHVGSMRKGPGDWDAMIQQAVQNFTRDIDTLMDNAVGNVFVV